MKLKLKNFRCYSDKTFEFRDKGSILIHGNSGCGKSSILMALNFCLYGIGTKIIKRGETSCSVEFEFEDIKIQRIKRPKNRLIVNEIYEDEVAQNIINQKFGNHFNITGYIEQNVTNTFIMMQPIEKLNILEKLTFNDININDIKIRCKSLIARRQMELTKTSSQLEMANSYLMEIDEPEEIEFPLKNCKNREIAMKNEEIRFKNCETKIKKSIHAISSAKEELNDLRILNTYIQTKEENIDNLIQSLEKLSIEEENNEYVGDKELENYSKRLYNLISLRDINVRKERIANDSEKLDEMKKKEIESIQSEIDKISVWEEYSREEANEIVNDTKVFIKDAQQIEFLKKQIIDIDERNYIENKDKLEVLRTTLLEKEELLDKILKQKEIYTCPSCDNQLQFQNDKLELISISSSKITNVSEDELRNDITKISKEMKILEKVIMKIEESKKMNMKNNQEIDDIINSYESEIGVCEELQNDLYNMQSYITGQLRLEKKLNDLKKNLNEGNYSSSIRIFEKDIRKQEISINEMLKELSNDAELENETLQEEELRNFISKEEKHKEYLSQILKQKKSLEMDKSNQDKQKEQQTQKYLEKYDILRNEEDILSNINENEEIIRQQEMNKINHADNLSKIEQYKKYLEEKKKYDMYVNKVCELETKEKDDTDKYNAVLMLKEKILESEMIAIMNTIESINSHAQIYLDAFFPNDPISVILKCFKENKKNDKPQINMDIFYKEDGECDLNTLSGGELARVVLAFTLALSDMFNTPMLLLDESTASLDEETTTIVFEAIQENMKDKPVIVIGHQLVKGVFDSVLEM